MPLTNRMIVWRRRAVAAPRLVSTAASEPIPRQTQQWLTALKKAPCLVCGAMPAKEKRADCNLSGFPLTCSPACANLSEQTHAEELQAFRQVREDIAYSTSSTASTLLRSVITRSNRQSRRTEFYSSPDSWEEFVVRFTDDPAWTKDARAIRLLSAAYTYVMTLGHVLPIIAPRDRQNAQVNLHMIGARAEAMMPYDIWGELADANPSSSFQIKLIGDHVPTFSTKTRPAAAPSIQLEHYSGLYHHVQPSTDALADRPDAFVLFNPGIGHPNLRELWQPTLEMILSSGQPALLTSFSRRDQERDLEALRAFEKRGHVEFLLSPRENPFKSRCFQLDPLNVHTPIQTNSYYMVVKGTAR